MTIIKKSDLEPHLAAFTARYEKLRAVVNGVEPNPNIYEQYSNNPDQYKNDFMEINPTELEYALGDFDSAIKTFKTIKKLQANKLGGGR